MKKRFVVTRLCSFTFGFGLFFEDLDDCLVTRLLLTTLGASAQRLLDVQNLQRESFSGGSGSHERNDRESV
jgi:hypothetical protein